METWTIPKAGEIKFELMEKFGENDEIIKEFLKGIINGVAQRTVEYFNLTNGKDHAFIDTEKAIQPTITMAIEKNLTKTFKPEFPVWRIYSSSKRGHLDYLVFYKRIAFAMELKLSHKGFYKNPDFNEKGIFKKFNKALLQLEGIENDKLLSFMDNTKAFAKIVFHPILFQSCSERVQGGFTDDLEKYQRKIEMSLNALFDDNIKRKKEASFKKKPNFKALWFLEKEISYLETGKRNRNYYYPALGFIGFIEVI